MILPFDRDQLERIRAPIEHQLDTRSVLAGELSDEQADAIWPKVLELAPDYERYVERTARRIPLVRLTPVTSERWRSGG